MTEHRWSGWPGAWCLDCGVPDPREEALADGKDDEPIDPKLMECPCPGANLYNPYKSKQ
jgi:hypothetical protein